ncbi:MAG: LppM family (lipo)protein [Candidatus Binatia bacterium]
MSKRFVSWALLPFALVVVAGCRIHVDLKSDGSGALTAKYRAFKDQTLEQQKKYFSSTNTTITKLEMDADKYVTAEMTFKDVKLLSSSHLFRTMAITQSVDASAGTTTLVGRNTNQKPGRLPDPLVEYLGKELIISLTVPGEIVKTNATKHEGDTATWELDQQNFLDTKESVFEVTYKTPKS